MAHRGNRGSGTACGRCLDDVLVRVLRQFRRFKGILIRRYRQFDDNRRQEPGGHHGLPDLLRSQDDRSPRGGDSLPVPVPCPRNRDGIHRQRRQVHTDRHGRTRGPQGPVRKQPAGTDLQRQRNVQVLRDRCLQFPVHQPCDIRRHRSQHHEQYGQGQRYIGKDFVQCRQLVLRREHRHGPQERFRITDTGWFRCSRDGGRQQFQEQERSQHHRQLAGIDRKGQEPFDRGRQCTEHGYLPEGQDRRPGCQDKGEDRRQGQFHIQAEGPF